MLSRTPRDPVGIAILVLRDEQPGDHALAEAMLRETCRALVYPLAEMADALAVVVSRLPAVTEQEVARVLLIDWQTWQQHYSERWRDALAQLVATAAVARTVLLECA